MLPFASPCSSNRQLDASAVGLSLFGKGGGSSAPRASRGRVSEIASSDVGTRRLEMRSRMTDLVAGWLIPPLTRFYRAGGRHRDDVRNGDAEAPGAVVVVDLD